MCQISKMGLSKKEHDFFVFMKEKHHNFNMLWHKRLGIPLIKICDKLSELGLIEKRYSADRKPMGYFFDIGGCSMKEVLEMFDPFLLGNWLEVKCGVKRYTFDILKRMNVVTLTVKDELDVLRIMPFARTVESYIIEKEIEEYNFIFKIN